MTQRLPPPQPLVTKDHVADEGLLPMPAPRPQLVGGTRPRRNLFSLFDQQARSWSSPARQHTPGQYEGIVENLNSDGAASDCEIAFGFGDLNSESRD